MLKCYDHKEKEEIALKILKSEDKKNEQGLNEITILKILKGLEGSAQRNII